MSVFANISIKLMARVGRISSLELLDALLHAGWSLSDQGKISYLPLGDKDDFDWIIQASLSVDDLRKIIESKEKENEVVGIIITWKDSEIGGSILFQSDNRVSFNLDINRKTIKTYKFTDFQWYLEKLIPPLNDAFGVEYFSCKEHK